MSKEELKVELVVQHETVETTPKRNARRCIEDIAEAKRLQTELAFAMNDKQSLKETLELFLPDD